MEYVEKVIPEAFHGTCERNCNSILQTGFIVIRSDALRMGDGVYFYESSFEDAFIWAKNDARCKGKVGVFGASIVVHQDYILDLQDKEVQFEIIKLAKYLTDKLRKGGRNDPVTDGVVINYICNKVRIDMVRGTFTDLKKVQKLHPKSVFSNYSQLVISVRNTDVIKNYWQEYP